MKLVIAAGFLLGFTASLAAAQPHAAFFAEGGVMHNRDMSWGNQHISNAGISAGGGLRIGSSLEIRVVIDVPPARTILDSSNRYRGTPPVITERIDYTSRLRNRTASVLLTKLVPAGRHVRVSASAGWSSSRRVERVTIATIDAHSGRTLESTQNDGGMGASWGGPIFAVGAIVPLSAHLGLVPEVRVVWYPLAENGSTILRTGLNARWTF